MLAFPTLGFAGNERFFNSIHMHFTLRIGFEVVIPGRVMRLPKVGRDQRDPVTIEKPNKWKGARLSAFRASGCDFEGRQPGQRAGEEKRPPFSFQVNISARWRIRTRINVTGRIMRMQ